MVDHILRNWIFALIFTIVIISVLWIPDFAGYNHSSLSFWFPVLETHYDGSVFDTVGYRVVTILFSLTNASAILILSLRYLSLGRSHKIIPLFYFLVIFSFPQVHLFFAAFPSTLLAIVGLFALFRAGEVKKPNTSLFLASFLSGCALLLYLPSLVIVISFVAIASSLNLFSGRKILIFLGGILFTLGGFVVIRYLYCGVIPTSIGILLDDFKHITIKILLPAPATLFMILVFNYFFLKAIIRWLHLSYGNMSYKHRVLSAVIWMSIVCGISIFLNSGISLGFLPIFAIPSSLLLGYYYSEKRITKRMEVEFIILLLSILFNQISYYL